MSANISRPNPVFTRRRAVTWAAGAAVAGATLRAPAVVAVANRQATQDGTTTFLDSTVVHDISVTFDQEMYDAMIETFRSSRDKEWIEATVTIDGSTYEKAGMRLKGNSSLGGLGGGPEGEGPDGFFTIDGTPVSELPAEIFQGEGTPEVVPPEGGLFRMNEGGGGATAETPERLPWLISLDRYVEDQNHNGLKELVIRSNRSETSLNEVVALELLDRAGLASQHSAAVRFDVNGSEPALRLAIEHPNDEWMAARFSPDGLLYKGEAGGDYSYRGDDPESYKDIFDLEAGGTGDDATDMKPLFDFLAFLNNSDDATFNAELPNRLDVDKFATYQAMMKLIQNGDDISGPGNNAYLYVGPDQVKFTVVPWDMNLAFSGMGNMNGPGEFRSSDGAESQSSDSGTPEADEPERRTVVGGPSMEPNILVTRSETFPGFADLVESELNRLRAELYESGTAAEVLSMWVDLLTAQAADLVTVDTIASESESIAELFV
jgi:spore coat protein CotH